MEGYIIYCSDYKKSNKYVTMTKRIPEYEGAEYKQGRDIRSTVENEEWYTIPRPNPPFTTSTKT